MGITKAEYLAKRAALNSWNFSIPGVVVPTPAYVEPEPEPEEQRFIDMGCDSYDARMIAKDGLEGLYNIISAGETNISFKLFRRLVGYFCTPSAS